MTQLLAVTVLSLAAKMEETIVLDPLDLQASAVIDYATHLHILCVFSFLKLLKSMA